VFNDKAIPCQYMGASTEYRERIRASVRVGSGFRVMVRGCLLFDYSNHTTATSSL